MGFLALAAGLGLSWALGIALVAAVYRLFPPREAIPASWVIGVGWFVGMLATTMTMRAVSVAGMTLSVGSIGGPMLAMAAASAWYAAHGRSEGLRATLRRVSAALAGNDLDGWQKPIWRLLVAWLAVRFTLLFAEVWLRPLYPWDAWTQWGTKARVWFEMRSIVPFADAPEWLSASSDAMLWFDAAPHYPATMPLMQTWGALLLGRWDDAYVNLPWWLIGVALCIALVGALTLLGFRSLAALAVAALVMTLPIVNVHVALAGYADLPMASYLVLGAVAALQAIRTRNPGHAVVALSLLVALTLVKNPGKAWIVTLLPAFIAAAVPRYGLRIAGAVLAMAACGVLLATRSGITVLSYKFTPHIAMPWGALFDAYFSFANWHLLWYLAIATVVVAWRQLLSTPVVPFTLAVLGGLLFLLIGFAFTHAAAWVEDQSTVNRATLHLAPLVVVWMSVCLREWWRDRERVVVAPAPD